MIKKLFLSLGITLVLFLLFSSASLAFTGEQAGVNMYLAGLLVPVVTLAVFLASLFWTSK